jgi:hypothetical protein
MGRFLKKHPPLKPCPFCGGPARIESKSVRATLGLTGFREGTEQWHIIGCMGNALCMVKPVVRYPADRSAEGIEVWNKRTPADPDV